MSESTSGDWLTVSQAAAALGVSERTVRRRCESGQLKARLESNEHGTGGRTWLIDRAAIEASGHAANHAATSQRTKETHAAMRPEEESERPEHAVTDETTARPTVESMRPEDIREIERQADRMQGYMAAQMEQSIARAVREAVEAAQVPLLHEIEQLRAEVSALNESRRNAPQSPPEDATSKEPPTEQSTQQQTTEVKRMPLWLRFFGLRF